jgi:hypothetical protein
MWGLAFIASDTLASVSCLDSGNLVHISSTWTDDIPPELSQQQRYKKAAFAAINKKSKKMIEKIKKKRKKYNTDYIYNFNKTKYY